MRKISLVYDCEDGTIEIKSDGITALDIYASFSAFIRALATLAEAADGSVDKATASGKKKKEMDN